MPATYSLLPAPLRAVLALCSPFHDAGAGLRRCPGPSRLHRAPPRTPPPKRTSDALPSPSSCRGTLLLVPPFSRRGDLRRPLLTSRSGSTPLPFQACGETSPGKIALLHCTTAGFTPPPLGHKSFVVSGPLALLGTASYPVNCSSAPSFAPTLPYHTRSPSCSCASLRSP